MAITASTRAVVYGPLVDYPTGKGTATSNLVTVGTPWGIKVRCHQLVRGVFLAACADAAHVAWDPRRIDSFAPRSIRGSTAVSLHAYGLAWDFFATPPGVVPPGGVWRPQNPVPAEFAACFQRLGFRWGADFGGDRVDLPHIEWPNDRPSAITPIPDPPPDPPVPPAEEDDMPPAPGPCVANDGHIWCFVRGTDGALWGQRDHGSWKRYGGALTSGPAAVPNGIDGVMVYGRGDDGATWRTAISPHTAVLAPGQKPGPTHADWQSEGGAS